jgi:hypothetical protein
MPRPDERGKTLRTLANHEFAELPFSSRLLGCKGLVRSSPSRGREAAGAMFDDFAGQSGVHAEGRAKGPRHGRGDAPGSVSKPWVQRRLERLTTEGVGGLRRAETLSSRIAPFAKDRSSEKRPATIVVSREHGWRRP